MSDLYMCSSTRNSIVIRADGNYYPCMNYDICVGKITDNKFIEVWNENKNLSFIQNMTWKDNYLCEKCNLKKYCMKCPGLSLRMNNDYSKCNDNNYKIAKIRNEIYE